MCSSQTSYQNADRPELVVQEERDQAGKLSARGRTVDDSRVVFAAEWRRDDVRFR